MRIILYNEKSASWGQPFEVKAKELLDMLMQRQKEEAMTPDSTVKGTGDSRGWIGGVTTGEKENVDH